MSLGNAQRVIYDCYTDCVERTKKNVNLSDDVVYFMLDTCSILEKDSNTSYSKTYDAVSLICHRLCPGEWCTRTHCENYSRHHAYNCIKTRPKVCKKYAKYIADKVEREKQRNQEEKTRKQRNNDENSK